MNSLTILSGAGIGGSCYLLELYGVRILFDCGTKLGSAYTAHPEIPSPETIDAIFVSHAHLDHMGAIAYTAAVCKNARIFMSEQTKGFVRYQLAATIAEYIGADTDDLRFHNSILCELIMNRIETIPYRSKESFKARNGQVCSFSMFHAGHVPGAAMVYVLIGNRLTGDRSILYTGDFAAYYTYLTSPYSLPEEVHPNMLLLCGTRANDPDYNVFNQNSVSIVSKNLYEALARNSKMVLPVSQLTKGLEILAMLEEMIEDGSFRKSKVFLEPDLLALARYYERTSDTFRLPSYIHPLAEWKNDNSPTEPIIVFERTGCDMKKYPNHSMVKTDFTLHADYNDLVNLIKSTDPVQVYVVHASKGKEAEALCREELGTRLRRIVYTKDKEVYEII